MNLSKRNWIIIVAVVVVLVVGGMTVMLLANDNNDGDPSASDLPQTVTFNATDSSYTLTVGYPEEWWASPESDFGIGITNDLELLQNLLGGVLATPESGKISGNIAFFSYNTLGDVGITPSIDIETALSAFVQAISGGAASINDTEVATVNGTQMGIGISSDGASDTQFMAIQIERGLIFGFFGTIEGELGQYRDTLLAIMASADFVDLSDE